MGAKARNFDVTYSEASGIWDKIAWSGEDTVAVARASYEAGGNARHRANAIAFLIFDARYSAEVREFAVELLEDRSPKVVRFASDTLAWGGDVSLLPRMRKKAAGRTDGAKRDIEDAIAQIESGNRHLFPDRTTPGGRNLMVPDHDWRQMRGGLIRAAQPRHAPVFLDITPEGASSRVQLVGGNPPLNEQEIGALVEAKSGWIVGAPISGTLIAQMSGSDWLIKSMTVSERELDSGLAWQLVEFAEQEGRRRGLERIVLNARARAWSGIEAFGRHSYREAERSGDEGGLETVLYEKAI